MKLHIIRHGEPDYEKDTLTPLGLEQAKALINLPDIMVVRRVLSSPLGRAKETARPVAQAAGIPVEIIPWLREMDDVVVWDKKRPDLAVWNMPPQCLSSMESGSWLNEEIFCGTKLSKRWEELCAGADAFLASYGIVRKNGGWSADALKKDSLELAVFCHLGVGLTLSAYLLDVCPPVFWRTAYLAPASVTTLLLEHREEQHAGFRMLRMGDVSHLVKRNIPAGTTGLQYNVT